MQKFHQVLVLYRVQVLPTWLYGEQVKPFSLLPQTHPAKFPLDRKEQTNAFIVSKALIKGPR